MQLLSDADGLPLNHAGVARLDELLTDVDVAHAAGDTEALRTAAISLAVLASGNRYLGQAAPQPAGQEPSPELPHQRINELVHRLITDIGAAPPAPDATNAADAVPE